MTKKIETTQTVPDIEPYTGAGKKANCPVHQYGLDGKYIKTFPSQYQAEKETKTTGISLCLSGQSKSAGGFQWRRA